MRRTTTLGVVVATGLTGSLLAAPMQASAGPGTATDARSHDRVTVVPVTADEEVSRTVVTGVGASTTREKSRLYRDGRGRTRVESGSTVTINDPASATTIRLDTSHRLVQRTTSAAPATTGKAPATGGQQVPSKQQQLSSPAKSLGTTRMQGVRVTGSQYTVTAPGAAGTKQVTSWLSNDIRLAVQTKVVDATGAGYTRTYTNIKAGTEPAADLFTVPAGYTEVREPAAATLDSTPCPLTISPDPLILESFGFLLGSRTLTATTDFANAACLIAGGGAYLEYPLSLAQLTPLPLPYLQLQVFDNGGALPYVPYLAFGDIGIVAASSTDTTTKDSLVILYVYY
jgi:hypothetical protein